MNLRALNIGHIRLISLYWSRYALRGGVGLVYLMIALILGLAAAHTLIMPVEQLIAHQKRETGTTDAEAIRKIVVDTGKPLVQLVLGLKSFKEIVEEGPGANGPGAKPEEDVTDFEHHFENSKARIREQVTMTLHGADSNNLTDAGLGLIKRQILEKTNRALGEPLLKEILMSKFNFVER